jgi:hypothetical protein
VPCSGRPPPKQKVRRGERRTFLEPDRIGVGGGAIRKAVGNIGSCAADANLSGDLQGRTEIAAKPHQPAGPRMTLGNMRDATA